MFSIWLIPTSGGFKVVDSEMEAVLKRTRPNDPSQSKLLIDLEARSVLTSV